MVLLKNPYNIFDFCKIDSHKELSVFCLMTDIKYASFEEDNRKKLEKFEDVTVIEKLIKSPVKPGKFLKCKFIQFYKWIRKVGF